MNMLLYLPGKKTKKNKTLVLDLDETLVHSTFEKTEKTCFQFDYMKNNKKLIKIYVIIRPGTKEFLQEMSKYYEIVVFTASQQQYCEKIVAQLDPENKYIDYKLSRNYCTMYQGVYVKDIRRLGRNIKDIIIIDNNPDCYLFSQENGYEIPSFFYDLEDKELPNLIPFLLEMKDLDDVRAVQIWKEKFDEIQKASLENICISSAWLASENILDDENDNSIEAHINLLQNNYSKEIKPSKFKEAEQSKEINNNYNEFAQINLAQLEATLMSVTPEGVTTRKPLKRQTFHLEKFNKYLKVNKNYIDESKTENFHEIRLKLNREKLKINDIRFDVSDLNVMSPLNKNQFVSGKQELIILN